MIIIYIYICIVFYLFIYIYIYIYTYTYAYIISEDAFHLDDSINSTEPFLAPGLRNSLPKKTFFLLAPE